MANQSGSNNPQRAGSNISGVSAGDAQKQNAQSMGSAGGTSALGGAAASSALGGAAASNALGGAAASSGLTGFGAATSQAGAAGAQNNAQLSGSNITGVSAGDAQEQNAQSMGGGGSTLG
jgi:hypothetical protein